MAVWPARRPVLLDAEVDGTLAALTALTDAYHCMRAMYCCVLESDVHADLQPLGGGTTTWAAAPTGPDGWPTSLPELLEHPGDFAALAVAARALRSWCNDADWELQCLAKDLHGLPERVAERHVVEVAGLRIGRCADDALHLAALAVGAAGGLWARGAALRLLRDACESLNSAIAAVAI